ncbi:hypothetical protein B4U80_13452 [Leptotrombidium deliense]|uniref:Uncharacterized protein n=1 Tax=Leptotrombidium deliense TaxID=299467 RepID=A0A443SU58_9ACAR|nr:hypothetical protein B4U80_13452 [Leptotrombidium deliense]
MSNAKYAVKTATESDDEVESVDFDAEELTFNDGDEQESQVTIDVTEGGECDVKPFNEVYKLILPDGETEPRKAKQEATAATTTKEAQEEEEDDEFYLGNIGEDPFAEFDAYEDKRRDSDTRSQKGEIISSQHFDTFRNETNKSFDAMAESARESNSRMNHLQKEQDMLKQQVASSLKFIEDSKQMLESKKRDDTTTVSNLETRLSAIETSVHNMSDVLNKKHEEQNFAKNVESVTVQHLDTLRHETNKSLDSIAETARESNTRMNQLQKEQETLKQQVSSALKFIESAKQMLESRNNNNNNDMHADSYNRIDELNSKIETFGSRIDAIDGTMGAFNSRIDAIETNVHKISDTFRNSKFLNSENIDFVTANELNTIRKESSKSFESIAKTAHESNSKINELQEEQETLKQQVASALKYIECSKQLDEHKEKEDTIADNLEKHLETRLSAIENSVQSISETLNQIKLFNSRNSREAIREQHQRKKDAKDAVNKIKVLQFSDSESNEAQESETNTSSMSESLANEQYEHSRRSPRSSKAKYSQKTHNERSKSRTKYASHYDEKHIHCNHHRCVHNYDYDYFTNLRQRMPEMSLMNRSLSDNKHSDIRASSSSLLALIRKTTKMLREEASQLQSIGNYRFTSDFNETVHKADSDYEESAIKKLKVIRTDVDYKLRKLCDVINQTKV